MSSIAIPLLRWNPMLQESVKETRETVQDGNKTAFKPAFKRLCRIYEASRHTYKKLADATYNKTFMRLRRSALVLEPTALMKTLDVKIAQHKGPVGIALLHLAWETELRDEILPVAIKDLAGCYTRWWLPEDNGEVKIDDRQLIHQIILDPKFEAESGGRLFASSPQFAFVNKRINHAFWECLSSETRTPLTPSFFKVSEALSLINANITVMRGQRGLRQLPDDLTVALDKSLEDGSFDVKAADALALTLAERIGVPVPTGLIDISLHSLHVSLLEIIRRERQAVFDDIAKKLKPIEIKNITDSMGHTRAWLARVERKEGEGLIPFFARAIVDLAENTPAHILSFPETFADDIRDFLSFYCNINGTIDAKIATIFAKRLMPPDNPIFADIRSGAVLKDMSPLMKRCIQRATRPTSLIRLLLMSRFRGHIARRIETTLLGKAPKAATTERFVDRMCRVALINFQSFKYE